MYMYMTCRMNSAYIHVNREKEKDGDRFLNSKHDDPKNTSLSLLLANTWKRKKKPSMMQKGGH